jgi:hypothetical protein
VARRSVRAAVLSARSQRIGASCQVPIARRPRVATFETLADVRAQQRRQPAAGVSGPLPPAAPLGAPYTAIALQFIA